MIVRFFAALIAICLVGGMVHAADLAIDDQTVELQEAAVLVDAPVVIARVPHLMISIEMPAIASPIVSTVESQTFRPPEA
ncbi:MAG: hypothetical protein QM831_40620 [Kofleriaceae bacterium]